MGMLGLKNMNAITAMTKRARRQFEGQATAVVKAKALSVLNEALKVSPQWSGNYVANWVIETNKTPARGYSRKFKEDPWEILMQTQEVKKAGDPEAIRYALQVRNKGIIDSLKWNSVIRLNNYAPVAPLIEAGEVKLRPGNSQALGNLGVVAHLKMKFKFVK